MKIVLLSDIHGNDIVLNAVLDDVRSVAYGHNAVIAAVHRSEHPAATFIVDHQHC